MENFDNVESPALRALLLGNVEAGEIILLMAVDYTYLQNEYSERCDGEDFAVDRWEEMQEALHRASNCHQQGDYPGCLAGLRDYWSRWERYSTIY